MPITAKRLFFEKRGRIKYTSHLDTMRAFTRALSSSELPLWYTEGFNPHLYLTFALPLALGCEGLRESVDIRLTAPVPDGDMVAAINKGLPPGLAVTALGDPVGKPADIAWADYELELLLPGRERELSDCLATFRAKESIEVRKRTKKGEKTVDIAPLATVQSVSEMENGCKVEVRLASGALTNINASLWLEAFYAHADLGEVLARIRRTAILCEDLTPFN